MIRKTLLVAISAMTTGLVWAVAQVETKTVDSTAQPVACAVAKANCAKANDDACAKKTEAKMACASANKKGCAKAMKTCPMAATKAKTDEHCKTAAAKAEATPAK